MIIVFELCARNYKGSVKLWWRLFILFMEKDTCVLKNLYHIVNNEMAWSSLATTWNLILPPRKLVSPISLGKKQTLAICAETGLALYSNMSQEGAESIHSQIWAREERWQLLWETEKWIHKCFLTVFNQKHSFWLVSKSLRYQDDNDVTTELLKRLIIRLCTDEFWIILICILSG